MKPEYKEKALSYLDGINSRIKVIQEMLEGKRPSNQEHAIKLTIELQRLLEQTENLIDLS
jgi:hypothetical protein